MTLSLLAVIRVAKQLAERDGRNWFELNADAMDQYMAIAADKLHEPAPAKLATDDGKTPW